MNRVIAYLFLAVSLFHGGYTYAQATRTWVSGVGDDANPCSRTAPCKTFAGAIPKTAASGEISALDPANFGPVTITKSITLSGDGTLAGITVGTGLNGIQVQAGPTDTIILRNLSVTSTGVGLNGISYTSGGKLIIEKCAIVGMSLSGVDVSLTANGSVTITDSSIAGGTNGISLGTTARLDGELRRIDVLRSGNGVNVQSGFVTIHDSLIAHNSGVGILTQAGKVVIEDTSINGNDTAVQVLGGFARLSNSSFFNNQNGLVCTGGPITSTFDNRKGGNSGGTLPICPEPLAPLSIL